MVNGKRRNPSKKEVHNDSPHVIIVLFFPTKNKKIPIFLCLNRKNICNLLPFFDFSPPTSSLLFLQQNGAITGLVQKVLHLFEGLRGNNHIKSVSS